jgi:PTH1 family peptidyl-tRNA hydrolase
MKLIVGLGNPGPEYAYTRHNVGFLTVDTLSKKMNASEFKPGYKGLISKGKHNNVDYIILKPLTFMNLSGDSVVEVANYYKINKEDIIVIYDDMDYGVGEYSIREKGGHGGHNGIRNIIERLATPEFSRIRIGIGKGSVEDKSGYVLGKFSKAELEVLRVLVNKMCEALIDFLSIDIKKVMTKYNTKEVK